MEYTKLIQLFKGYSIPKNQSIILATLTQNKNYLTAKQISQKSKLTREAIYKNLFKLKERGLLQKTITKPKKYCAIPLKSSISLLREEKIQETCELENLASQVLEYNDHNPEKNQNKNSSKFILIPKKKQLVNNIDKSIFNSKKSIKITTSWRRHLQAMIIYEKSLKASLENGIKHQFFITMKPKQDKIPKNVQAIYDSPNCSIKFVDTRTKNIILIVDDQEVFFITKPNSDLVESSALWSNNQSLIASLVEYFDLIWERA